MANDTVQTSIDQALVTAAEAEQAGDREGALRRLSALLDASPGEPRALLAMARLLQTDGRAAEAAEVLARFDPQTVPREMLMDALLLRASLAAQLGMPEEERRAIDDALAVDPYCWPARLQLGSLLERSGRPKEAARTYRDALRIGPPRGYRPASHVDAFERAERVAVQYVEALELVLEQSVSALPAYSDRWREAASILAGRTQPFLSRSNRLAVPRLPAQPFFRREAFPWVPALEAKTDAIRAEMLAAFKEQGADFEPYIQYRPGEPVNQWAELNNSPRWSTYHLIRAGEPVEKNLARCPQTAAALAGIDSARLAGLCPNVMFSVLAPKTRIPPHHGESNARLVAHLPLVVPEGCWFRVGYDYRLWKEGEVLVFDDTIEHEAANESDQLRVVMIFDVWNPYLSLEERALVQRLSQVEHEFREDAPPGG